MRLCTHSEASEPGYPAAAKNAQGLFLKLTLAAGLLVLSPSCGTESAPTEEEVVVAKKEVGKPKKKKKKKRPMKPVPGPIDGGMARPTLPSYTPLS